MKQTFSQLLIAVIVMSTMVACGNKGNNDADIVDECYVDNPIDSILHNTDVFNRFDAVYNYLSSHPEFLSKSDSIGYYYYACDDNDRALLWKECGDIRVYSIPWESIHSALGYNIVQIKGTDGKYRLDTTFLNECMGRMDNLFKITNRTGKTYYLLKTNIMSMHQGTTKLEYVNVFSIENGRLVKESLFHTKTKQYDVIEVECGGQRYLPLDYSYVSLICMENFEEDEDYAPVVVIAEINENDWPTGYGLKYQWNGDWFEYVGKCHYDSDDMI